MKTILRGNIKNMYVAKQNIIGGSSVIELEDAVIKKDAEFYYGLAGKRISFDYGTFLPTRDEATAFIRQSVGNNPNTTCNTCVFVDYDELVPEKVTNEKFKQLKKTYRQTRKSR